MFYGFRKYRAMHDIFLVCMFICVQGISKSCGWIWTKHGGQVGCAARTNLFDLGEDSNPDLDTGII